ncbi:hypothetical protein N3K66_006664 [Trichothecium roseum]|uniref:Uncharacterized protein n=1 Tax=Trichothecium roseum TaxID=47278 RepID=A0ACC0UW49_9HYPO|nr:hypothetical protein N3K66_006664 [Trichothecium roseum]
MGDTNGKSVTFQDGCEDDSDDDCKSVEVTFDPANPYRRKSSLISSDTPNPLMRKKNERGECIVHQFFDSQRRARNAASEAESEVDGDAVRAHPSCRSPRDGSPDKIKEKESQSIVEPRTLNSRVQVDPKSLNGGGAGQQDQQTWTQQMTRSVSELDLAGQDDVHSRTLTKKQLSDMAWSVRELSRRLSSMRIRFRVKTIFLLTKVYDQDLIPKTRELTQWLLHAARETRYTVYVQDKLEHSKKFDVAGLLNETAKTYTDVGEEAALQDLRKRLRYWDENICRTRPQTFDFVITLGGDGTVLYASWLFQRIVPPVLSFALGSLGFLTKFDFDEFAPTLNSAFAKGVTVSLRLRFEGTVMRSQKRKQISGSELPDSSASTSEEDNGESSHKKRDLVEELIGEEKEDAHTHRPDGTFEILNEIVVDRGPNPTMSYTELFGDDEHFTSILADGICVSTPTGSTAYNLAAGGSLCHPENPVMLVTSICAHTLSFRPIILPDTIVLRVGVPYDARTASWASFDGRERVELHPGDYVTISASRYPFASVQAEGRRSEDWVNSISGKLGWNTRQKQKGYKEWET